MWNLKKLNTNVDVVVDVVVIIDVNGGVGDLTTRRAFVLFWNYHTLGFELHWEFNKIQVPMSLFLFSKISICIISPADQT